MERWLLDKLCNLLFELSNEDRLTILTRLKEEPMKLTHISQKLGYTPQEAARNISRLSEASLIIRSTDGVYSLTQLGDASLRLLDGYKFLSEQSKYFEKHTLKDIPGVFLDRIGELIGAEPPIEVMAMINKGERIAEGANEYILTIVDTVYINFLPYELESIRRGVKNRTIVQRDYKLPPGSELMVRQEEKALAAEGLTDLLEEHWIDRADVYLVMSEKEVAGVAFRNLDGVFDHLYFSGSDERFHGWCKDLFEYYWARSTPAR